MKSQLSRTTYYGLVFTTLATLVHEILLTRIFSVTLWYHFAFMVVSLAMFGLAFGAILVYLLPEIFSLEKTERHLSLVSSLLALSIVISFFLFLAIQKSDFLHQNVYSIINIYIIFALPFVLSGIITCLVLTRFPIHTNKLYAADLIGAALGCLVLILVLKTADAVTAIFITAFFASLGTIFFASRRQSKKILVTALFCTFALGMFITINTYFLQQQKPILRLMWGGSSEVSVPVYEKWNSFSYVSIWPRHLVAPFAWGLSGKYHSSSTFDYLNLLIDNNAGTVLTPFDGNLEKLNYLKYDLTNLIHYLRPNSNVLVVGSGGGRDILSSLVFKQKSVIGIEVNENILNAVNKVFGNFTGHLDQNPRVTFVNDEARSYIARTDKKFDIIQISLIDTWAATAAGAFTLTENALYTVEAWKVFLEHLTPAGVLTLSRWYSLKNPYEMYKLFSLANTTLKQIGVKNTGDCIIIMRNQSAGINKMNVDAIGTMLVSKTPFSSADIAKVKKIAQDMNFELIFYQGFSKDSVFSILASNDDSSKKFIANFPFNIKAPTDNSPFFFSALKIQNIFQFQIFSKLSDNPNLRAILFLNVFFFTTLVLTLLCIILPLVIRRKSNFQGSLRFFIFFMSIGMGFMLFEIAQMQRLIIFLGNPTYTLSVVLFSLLLSSGLGSLLAQKMISNRRSLQLIFFGLLLICLAITAALLPSFINQLYKYSTPLRVVSAIIMLFPVGFLLGVPFPMGMRAASLRVQHLTPWFWGINGATSVVASVLAVIIGMSFGITITFWSSFLFYAIAFLALSLQWTSSL